MAQQTAVEWLETQIIKFHNWKRNPIYDEKCFDEIELDKSIKQAKQMEREQIVKAHGLKYFDLTEEVITGEQYYNETYGK